jgi:Protein of unknown function (DUF3309)
MERIRQSANLFAARLPMLRTILLIVVILALLGSLPMWPYSSGWGYYPSGGLGLLVLILIVFMLMDRRAV